MEKSAKNGKHNELKMRDYTTNNYCDFLWISDLLELKKNSKNSFTCVVRKNQTATTINVTNVTIFGTIVEVKQIGPRGFIYHVDDGTGVIACKHNGEQFEEVISMIETEHQDVLNETLQFRQYSEQTLVSDISADDSVFNDRSIQLDEIDINKKGKLKGLQSIWDEIFETFNSLIESYNIGDSVCVQGKLYNYFHMNQVYVNNIRLMDFREEIMKVAIKLEDGYDPVSAEGKSNPESRLSGLMTFDNITHLDPRVSHPRNIETPKGKAKTLNENVVVTPHLDSTITFDTLSAEM